MKTYEVHESSNLNQIVISEHTAKSSLTLTTLRTFSLLCHPSGNDNISIFSGGNMGAEKLGEQPNVKNQNFVLS